MAEFVIYGRHSYHQSSVILRTPRDHHTSLQTTYLKNIGIQSSPNWRAKTHGDRCTWSSTPTRAVMSSKTTVPDKLTLTPAAMLMTCFQYWQWVSSLHPPPARELMPTRPLHLPSYASLKDRLYCSTSGHTHAQLRYLEVTVPGTGHCGEDTHPKWVI